MKHDSRRRPLVVGEGRISGYLSITLGVLSTLAVLCFLFPDALTTPELRAGYDLGWMRVFLGVGMVFSAGFGVLTFVLGRQRHLGALGLLLTGLAFWLGGTGVQVGPRYTAPGYIGLDWFILDLLGSALIFVLIEKIVPREPGQPVLRPDFWHDARYFVFNHLTIGIFIFIGHVMMPRLFAWSINADLQAWFRDLPGIVQFAVILFLADLVEYAIHRTMHEVPWLWRIHAVHHSAEHMDWLAGSRLHVLEPLVTRALVMLPAFVLGAEPGPLLCYVIFAGFQAGLIHANVGLRFGLLEYVFTTPRYHHWHHASDREAVDVNYAAHLPIIDRLFGTHHLPSRRWPDRYGVIGEPLPKGMVRQFLYPFRRRAT
ncbi:sterol desaturase family protein [Roseomonas sp. CCTCC AB2023176]|uniref:sterol desaturase family protein n=1 Tax=Roseomonas sp. CCTCC AB2023176 TaxID=3342640 RepID=UPI0035D63397